MADLTRADVLERATAAGLEAPRVIPRKARGGAVHTMIAFGPAKERRYLTIAERPDRMPEAVLMAALAGAQRAGAA